MELLLCMLLAMILITEITTLINKKVQVKMILYFISLVLGLFIFYSMKRNNR